MVNVIAESYVNGVSTRRVEELVTALGVSGLALLPFLGAGETQIQELKRGLPLHGREGRPMGTARGADSPKRQGSGRCFCERA